MPNPTQKMENEWSCFFDVAQMGKTSAHLNISADEAERSALTRRLNLRALEMLSAEIVVTPEHGGKYHVNGVLNAALTQECVVSGEDVETTLQESFDAWFIDPEFAAVSFVKAKQEKEVQKNHAEVQMLEEEEDPESLIDGQIDLGELVTQYLSLALNPYPHKEGVFYEVGDDTPPRKPAEIRKNPFEALKKWKEER